MPSPAALKKIRPIQLIAVIFFTVSGGPYGLEPLLSYAGDHAALIILLITPLLWDVPAILTVLELNSMMPVNGGYYKWVKHALGIRWGFYEGWWTWLYTFVDLAIYPVLFVMYASFFYPELTQYKIQVCLIVIWASAGLNILGIVPVGKASLFLSAIVLAPVVIVIVLALHHHSGSLTLPAPSFKGLTFPSFGMALYTVMWNCLGWDNVTTYAEEVERPVRSYILSIIIAFTLVIMVYFFITWVAQQSGINHTKFTDEGMPALGVLIAGHWLGVVVAVGGMASSLGIYAAVLLSVSRVPHVMAQDKLLSAGINRLHKRFNTPFVSIIICSLVVSFMILWKLGELFIIDVTVYGAGLSLEYISLVKLRIKEPDSARPFKIPLGVPGLCILLMLPVLVYVIALAGTFSSEGDAIKASVFAIIALLSAEVAWQRIAFFAWLKRWYKRNW
ncbi:APC family permease [Mucilaginibacter sp. AW1-7]|uniref:APC family permease n=1 Tax=Mucilaginibacter sp. AW1-7 TaxID=3349874 RepID=UPI003F741F40